MALTPRLDMRQTQALVMTPQLQQAIKLLQFSNLELAAYVETQIEENPLLERDESAGDALDADGNGGAPDDSASSSEVLRSVDQVVSDNLPIAIESALDMDSYDNVFDAGEPGQGGESQGLSPDLGGTTWSNSGGGTDGAEFARESTIASIPSLREHLTAQMGMDIDDPVERLIGIHLIDMLDDSGYLVGDLDQVTVTLGCERESIEQTLRRLQCLDPPGIFARSLAECLRLQLIDRGRLDPPMEALLDHLVLLADHHTKALARICQVDQDRLSAMVAEIRTLNPKPALAFDLAVAEPVTPDILVRTQPGGGWLVELNSETLPRVLVNNQYYAQISSVAGSKKDKQYINECFQSANWLIKALHQRATTILKVATEIIRQQDDFFVHGVNALKPLILRDVAEAIDMHESTISRVTSNKFMSTPRGTFELKYFFTHGVGGTRGGDVFSVEVVRQRIKKLIEEESWETVMSDDALVDVLHNDGIDIARRTVAKYRETMGIPSSPKRRRLKSRAADLTRL